MTDSDCTVRQLLVNPGDDRVSQLATELAYDQIQQHGEAVAIGVLLDALRQAFVAVLHLPSPTPENNILGVRRMLDALKDQVMEHASCAMEISEGHLANPEIDTIPEPKGRVH